MSRAKRSAADQSLFFITRGRLRTNRYLLPGIIVISLLSGCLEFTFEHAKSAVRGQRIPMKTTVTVDSKKWFQEYTYLAILLPAGWHIAGDSVVATGAIQRYYHYNATGGKDFASWFEIQIPAGYKMWYADNANVNIDSGAVQLDYVLELDTLLGVIPITYYIGESWYPAEYFRSAIDTLEVVPDSLTPARFTAAYSPSAIALQWVPPLTAERVSGYTVYRDGTVIATLGNAETSYIDASPLPGIREYTLAAVLNNGAMKFARYGVRAMHGDRLYVSAEGNNAHHGATPEFALKNISEALSLISADSLHPKTIVVAEGVYGPSASGEKLPLNAQPYVTIQGAGADKTILDGEHQFSIVRFDGVQYKGYSNDLLPFGMNNVMVRHGGDTGEPSTIGIMIWYADVTLENMIITGMQSQWRTAVYIQNSNATMRNLHIYDNSATDFDGGVVTSWYAATQFVNCNIVYNDGIGITSSWLDSTDHVIIKNSIIYGNGTSLKNTSVQGSHDSLAFNVSWSNIEGGWPGEGNINAAPLFGGNAGNLFLLDASSPCIDAGDPDPAYYDISLANEPFTALFPAMGTRRNDMGANGGPGAKGLNVQTRVDEDVPAAVPAAYRLEQNYPNPFNPSTTIVYSIPQNSTVTITVYDILGKEIQRLVHGEKQAGTYQVRFDGSTAGGKITSGIYFYTLTAGNFRETKKMILLQ